MHRTQVTGRFAAAAVAALVLASLAGCSSSGDGPAQPAAGSSTPAPGSAPSSTGPAAPSVQAAANTLSVTALDQGEHMSYEVKGTPAAGLVTMTFTNAGDVAHEMSVSLLKPGVSLTQVKAALSGPDGETAATKLLQNPDAEYPVPQILGPGLSETVTAKLSAGHYLVVCFLPGKGGMPHVAMGMLGEFTVSGGASDAQPPASDGTVELTDHKIVLPTGFGDGGTVRVTNTGTKAHSFSLAKLAGKPLSEYFQCVAGSFSKGTVIDSCPGTLVGGVGTLEPGQSAYFRVQLASGTYGYVSTEGDGADFQAGLAGTFTHN